MHLGKPPPEPLCMYYFGKRRIINKLIKMNTDVFYFAVSTCAMQRKDLHPIILTNETSQTLTVLFLPLIPLQLWETAFLFWFHLMLTLQRLAHRGAAPRIGADCRRRWRWPEGGAERSSWKGGED